MPDPGFSYDAIADRYVAGVDSAPYNALYERPAMLALLPDVAGREVLDAGCGAGWYAERLLERGARVTGVDASAAMLAHARRRLGDRVPLLHHDLAEPLPFRDGTFDVAVAPLVLHYLQDPLPALRELRRVLRPDGTLLLSTHHPCFEAARVAGEGKPVDYFATEPVEEEWEHAGRVRFFRRPLTAVFEALAGAGFLVERVVEPRPGEALRASRPEIHAILAQRPAFLCVRALVRP